MKDKKDIRTLDPADLDQVLKNKYRLGLYDFGYFLSELAQNTFFESQDGDIVEFDRHTKIPPLGHLYRDKDELGRLKEKTLELFDIFLDREPRLKDDKDFKKTFADWHKDFKKYKDKNFYDYMHFYIPSGRAGLLDLRTRQKYIFECLLDHVETEIACADKKPGRPIESENMLYYAWASHIKSNNPAAKVHWETIVKLHGWFWERLGKYKSYSWLRPFIKDIKSINDQFYKEKRKWDKFYRYICSAWDGFYRYSYSDKEGWQGPKFNYDKYPSMPIYFGRRLVFRFWSKELLQETGLIPNFKGKGLWRPVKEYEKLGAVTRKNINSIIRKYPDKKILIFSDIQFSVS